MPLSSDPERRRFVKDTKDFSELRFRVEDGVDPHSTIPGFKERASAFELSRRLSRTTGEMQSEDGHTKRVDVLYQEAGPIGRLVALALGMYPNRVTVTQYHQPLVEDVPLTERRADSENDK